MWRGHIMPEWIVAEGLAYIYICHYEKQVLYCYCLYITNVLWYFITMCVIMTLYHTYTRGRV